MATFEEGSATGGYKLFTGLTDVSVIAVNPTQEQAAEFGINMKNPPVYATVDPESGNKKVRLDIYVHSETADRIDKIAFFLENAEKISGQGNVQVINDYGASTWGESVDAITGKYEWFKPLGARKAISGEPELVSFIKTLLNVGRDSIAKLDSIPKMFDNDVSELKALFAKFQTRKVQALYTVRENDGNWYQGIYSRYFGRAGNKTTKYWEKHFNGSTNPPNFQNSYAFQEFNPLEITTGDAPASGTGDAPKSIWGK